MIFIYSYSQCRIMLATKLPRPRQWRFIAFANLMFQTDLTSIVPYSPVTLWKNHKTDITGDTQTGPCRRQFILFWIGIGVFIFVEKGKQQEEKREEKKNQP